VVIAVVSCEKAVFVKPLSKAEAARALLNWRRLRDMSFLSLGIV
jgi:hypothetical protein